MLVQEHGAAAPVLLEALWLKSVVTPYCHTTVSTSQPVSRQEELKRQEEIGAALGLGDQGLGKESQVLNLRICETLPIL